MFVKSPTWMTESQQRTYSLKVDAGREASEGTVEGQAPVEETIIEGVEVEELVGAQKDENAKKED